MRAVIQRVSSAAVRTEGREVASISRGLLILVGVGRGDAESDAAYLAEKSAHLRIFPDASGHMNLSLLEVGGEILVVSQFTLYADTGRGRRPGYADAAPPETARPLYESFVAKLRAEGLQVQEGVFGAMMDVALVNEGPVTILLDSRKA
jgi:D-tyrosyl-tRNA(Tyr) deacylase